MNRMQFGTYLFDQNPRRIELSRAHNLAAHTLPGTGVAMQDTGPRCRTARCEGEVFGDTADTALDRLASLSARPVCAGRCTCRPASNSLRRSAGLHTPRRATGGCLHM